MHKPIRYWRAALICAFLLCFAAPSAGRAQQRAPNVFVAMVEERQMTATTPLIGRIVAAVQSDVAARAPGVVEEVFAQVGDDVAQGAPLARLDATLHQIDLRAAEAALSQAQAGLQVAQARKTRAEQTLARQARLRGSAAFSGGALEDLTQDLAEASAEVARSGAQLESAKAAQARAQYALKHTQINAPFPGVIMERFIAPGAYVALSDPIVRLLDLSALEIEVDAPSDMARHLRPGMRLAAQVAGVPAEATLRAVVPQDAQTTQTRPIRLSFDAAALPEGVAAVGRAATVHLPVGPVEPVLTAPKDALIQRGAGWRVFVHIEGAAESRFVRIGRAVGERVEILDGLSAGEEVVVRGNERLRPGQKIRATHDQTEG